MFTINIKVVWLNFARGHIARDYTSKKGMAKKEDLAKVEEKINTIKDNKKMMDNTINGVITRMSKLEKEMEIINKERAIWKEEKEA